MADAPSIVILDRSVVFQKAAKLAIEVLGGQSPDIAVVVDIYAFDNPVHPEGHLGWWKFEGAILPHRTEVDLWRSATELAISLGSQMPVDEWVNPDRPDTTRLIVHVVLRSNATNALLAEDRVPVMGSEGDVATLQQAFDRDWARPRLAMSPYVISADSVVHIVAPAIRQRDGVGNLCLDIFRLLKQNDVPVRLYADDTDLSLSDLVEPQIMLPRRVKAEDQLLYFCSIADRRLSDIVDLPCRKAAYFHGITDPTRLRVFDPELAVNAGRAIAALPLLGSFDKLAANSKHSAKYLARALGCDPDGVRVIAPKLISRNVEAQAPAAMRGPDLLTVGQLNPHKKIDDVLRLFAAYLTNEPSAKCHVVGRSRQRAYRDYLEWVERSELALPQGAVVWHGSVDEAELDRLYHSAAALVSMSEDEGFCLPLIEAMGRDLPVLAYGIPAVLETLGGAGLAFAAKEPQHLSTALLDVLRDGGRRSALLERQRERYAELSARMTGREFFDLLQPEWPLTSD